MPSSTSCDLFSTEIECGSENEQTDTHENIDSIISDPTMAMRAALLLSLLHSCYLHPLGRPTNGLNQCRTTLSITALEVLPGGGWDNLRNMDMGRVMNLSYSQCQTTEDGLYLLPDEVFVIPQKQTGVESNSEILSSWLEVKSTTSHTINMDASYPSVLNAKFSVENQRMKTHQVQESSTTARVQVGFVSR